ncbi:MAG: ATP-binding protein [Bacteroidaceae bacterium]|nr:ATP-binding protein [Bacteroidaceae bacterium]
MERNILHKLLDWKNSKRRKPLIVEGARQVGKTWAIREFAKRYYDHLAYINYEETKHLQGMFLQDYDTNRILRVIRTQCGVPCEAGKTLIFLDEIQEADGGLTALKYFCENCPEHHIIVAGSLLGISLHRGISFPVGKVNFIQMHPMNFCEFLMAVGDMALVSAIEEKDTNTLSLFHDKLTNRLKEYFLVGGMPEAVQAYADDAEWSDIREIHNEILRGYEDDFYKHAEGALVERLRQVWRSIPSQLSRENKKFLFGLIRNGARAREYEVALQWLFDAGILHQVSRVTKPGLPLSAYRDGKAFKVYLNDIGLLCAMSGLEAKILLEGSAVFTEFKGALTEQFVFQQLHETTELFYWSKDNSQQEVDFLLQHDNELLPIECKAEENLKSKSLKSFIDEHDIKHAVKVSMKPYNESAAIVTNAPLYIIPNSLLEK